MKTKLQKVQEYMDLQLIRCDALLGKCQKMSVFQEVGDAAQRLKDLLLLMPPILQASEDALERPPELEDLMGRLDKAHKELGDATSRVNLALSLAIAIHLQQRP